jgi:mannobiose 2-epimerase
MDEAQLAADAQRELLENILPFWRQRAVDRQLGGFIGELSNDLRLKPDAPKGLILNARILWTFSAAFGLLGSDEDAELAIRAKDYLLRHFLDPQHGGYVWTVSPQGDLLDGSKKTYGQAFCVYALAEFARVFDDAEAHEHAVAVFRLIETRARELQHGGYVETLARDWQPCADVRLSDKDMNEQKSMNNHLHVLEAYANLLRLWPDAELAAALRELIDVFRRHILRPDGRHFDHFFDDAWQRRSDSYTFGHDIEGSWLLCEAADALGDADLQTELCVRATRIAEAVLHEGLDRDGGLFYEARNNQIINAGKEWWPQAEAVVGFYNAWQISGRRDFLDAAIRCWQYIQAHIVDRTNGEWFWRILPDGRPDPAEPKVSAWKCPYHNARCCIEIIHRAENKM